MYTQLGTGYAASMVSTGRIRGLYTGQCLFRGTSMKTFGWILLLLLVSEMAVHSAEPFTITTSQAKELVVASLTAQQGQAAKARG